MCLGIPGEIMEIRESGSLRVGKVRFAGIIREVCLEYDRQSWRRDHVDR